MIQTTYKGSVANFESVKNQIRSRWPGEEDKFDASSNCATYKQWQKNNYYVIPGEKALKAMIIVEKKDKATGKIIARYPKKISLFCWLQVKKMS
jgi:hypothetical protein